MLEADVAPETADVWPPARMQRLLELPLPQGNTEGMAAAIRPLCIELAALADRAREQQGDELLKTSEKSADLLIAIADRVPDASLAEAIRLQATALSKPAARRDAACRTAALSTAEFTLWCGPLATWYGKSRELFHSVLLCERSPDLCTYVSDLDNTLRAPIDGLNGVLASELSLGDLPSFVVGQLLACGGEANTAPKHFSYFLPEDLGVGRTRTPEMTVVFANVYLARYKHISAPASRAVLTWSDLPDDELDALRLLLLWFRGHDTAHAFRSHETDYRALRKALGAEGSVVLQEALVDVLGLLAALSVADKGWLGMTPSRVASVFLAEMLGYLRRGVAWFPDSGAAAVQLAFLLEHGAVALDAQGRLSWDLDQFRDGLLILARYLVRGVLQGDVGLARDGLDRYLERPPADAKLFIDSLRPRLQSLPTSFSYCVRH